MKKVLIPFLFVLFFTNTWSQPRPVNPSSTIIIDTDCGFDDMRAISLLLPRPEIIVEAVLTSDGSMSPEEGAGKVSHYFTNLTGVVFL